MSSYIQSTSLSNKNMYIFIWTNGEVTFYSQNHIPLKFQQQVCVFLFLTVGDGLVFDCKILTSNF